MRVRAALVVVVFAATVGAAQATASDKGDTSGVPVVRHCPTAVVGSAADLEKTLRTGSGRRAGHLAFTSLEYLNLNVTPTGLFRPGRYFGIKWALGVVGQDPLRVVVHGHARMDFRLSRVTGQGVPLSTTEMVVELHPCAASAATFFYGGMVLLNSAPRCVSLSAVDLRTGQRWTAPVGVARHC